MTSFETILVANRGEIAVRIMRTARALGYRTVAIYSAADADAPHVNAADDAALIGPAPAADSYLNIERILAAAKATGADAVHPGYGFLSENAGFARACEAAGLVFIGPTAEAIDLMGNKAAAKRHMTEAGVPCVPGYHGADQSYDLFLKEADRIGFPVMVKAATGGGGRGMRQVAEAVELPDALTMARSEAENAFGSGELILEKAIIGPRHVEMQVFADIHGNVIHLGERDCSVQRRHQKVIEEAPCPVMTEELRERMGAAAVEAARSIGYRGAGTVEFLLEESGAFYFLEMNTRLQVEHPVTEMTTGLDLVELQIRVARGEPLGLTQSDVRLDGHAIEARLYAEDPGEDFLPCTGRIELWRAPDGPGVRVDAGIETGLEVSPFYDAMVAKIIAWGETRDIALRRLVEALDETALFGPRSNRDFLIAALTRPRFAAGEATTAFLAEELSQADLRNSHPGPALLATAAALQYAAERTDCAAAAVSVSDELLGWSSAGHLATPYHYQVGEERVELTVSQQDRATYRVERGEERTVVTLRPSPAGSEITDAIVNGHKHRVVHCIPEAGRIHVSLGGQTASLRNRVAVGAAAEEAAGGGSVLAPMHGMLLEIQVAAGDTVSKGDRLAVLEAMKMQHEIAAPVDGVVREVLAKAGEQIGADEIILEIEIEIEIEVGTPDE